MSIAIAFAGSIIPTLNQHHVIGTVSNTAVCQLFVDTGNMQNGDGIELRVIDQLSFGTASVSFYGSYAHQQGSQIKMSPPIPVFTRTMFSLKQTDGTPRTFFFEVRTV